MVRGGERTADSGRRRAEGSVDRDFDLSLARAQAHHDLQVLATSKGRIDIRLPLHLLMLRTNREPSPWPLTNREFTIRTRLAELAQIEPPGRDEVDMCSCSRLAIVIEHPDAHAAALLGA